MITIEEFHEDFLQDILSDAESRDMLPHQSFLQKVAENLVENGELSVEYSAAECNRRAVEVHGYDIDEERRVLTLINHEYLQEPSIQTVSKATVDTKFSRLKGFLKLVATDKHTEFEESSDAFSMALSIRDAFGANKVDRIRLMVLTDGRLSRNITELPSEEELGFQIDFRVVDIDYIFKLRLADYIQQDFIVDVDLPSLAINQDNEEYRAYLTSVPGEVLFDIYEKHGQRLFEQNVRTFLQFKGKINKGIRNTIEQSPEKFFAYNNGITATASGVDVDERGHIVQIRNFQIVNGGQTTSSIYAAKKVFKKDVSKVSVQMKLSVVSDPDKLSDFVSRVARYANTQNKVNDSDFFSNSPFHKDMKTHSKTVRVAAVQGMQRQTYWFYERTRGEYLNNQAYSSEAEKKKFQLENPKSQLIDKTFLAKSEMSWHQYPYIVSRGAQYAFNKFAEVVTDALEKDNEAITSAYFKQSVAKVIMFKETEKIVSNADWYDGGFRAQIVTYSIALLAKLVADEKKFFNFATIWDSQALPDEIKSLLKVITKAVHDDITNPAGGVANIAQWCKKEECWKRVRSISLDVEVPESFLLDKEEVTREKVSERKDKKMLTGIQIQSFVVTQSPNLWKELYDHYSRNGISSGASKTQMDILKTMADGRLTLPTEAQSRRLYEVYQMAILDGVEGLTIIGPE